MALKSFNLTFITGGEELYHPSCMGVPRQGEDVAIGNKCYTVQSVAWIFGEEQSMGQNNVRILLNNKRKR